ncbi:sensor histidine kinase [Acidicapsa ligni]|uniref:sensor histidine kinase n=1 Tax=Acidicapsa ligni TaxID=542300 RepID=UPI0021E0D153|nr:sensor histidine kinase [Acidicapsa ligni]
MSLGCASPLSALDPGQAITQYAHRFWGEKDGYHGLTYAFAQTRDGFLWLATDAGLYRFDGIHFEHYEPPAGRKLPHGLVTSLLALPDGGLWIGYPTGASILRNGRITTYGEAEGLPGGSKRKIVRDRDGTIWITTNAGLLRFDGHRWAVMGKSWNCPPGKARAALVDSRGTLWVAIGNSILYLRQGAHRFEDTGEFALEALSIAEAPDGGIWMADTQMAVRPVGMPGSPRLATARCAAEAAARGVRVQGPYCNSANQLEIQVGSVAILFDRNGSLWIPTLGDGLRRSRSPLSLHSKPIAEFGDELEQFTSKEGLSADYTSSIFEDREGNIWVGTRDGLDEFSSTTLVPVVFPTKAAAISIAPGKDGYVWATSNFDQAAEIYGDSMKVPSWGLPGAATYRDSLNRVWFRGNTFLKRLQDGKFEKVIKFPASSADLTAGRKVQIAGDDSGTLWAIVGDLGFFSLDGDKWKSLKTPPEIAKLMPSTAYTDPMGLIWVGYEDGTIATLENGKLTAYPAKETGLRVITSFSRHGSQIWVGGTKGGIALFDGGRFRTIRPWDEEAFSGVTGVVDAGGDGLWLNDIHGVIRIPAGEVRNVVQDSSYRVHYDTFDSSDGLPGKSPDQAPFPTAIRGTDGRLWFVARQGVAWVDPAKIPKNLIQPPVSITKVLADSSSLANLNNLRLPAQTATIQISYTGLSLAVPERVRFKYKLNKVDKDWQEPGTRREAYYDHLSPGHYHFQVIACNNDGLWNEQGDTLDFILLPAWYQTLWFYVLEGLIGIGILWAIYWLRLRQIAHAISARFDERLAERTRIAGDLHDTLLQNFQAVLLNFHTVGYLLPDRPAEAEDTLKSALGDAHDAITEARNAVQGLRISSEPAIDLDRALLRVPQELCLQHVADFRVTVDGIPRRLSPAMRDEIYLIAREAIANSFRHTEASLIEVAIVYSPHELCVRMRDNGGGIDPQYLQSGREGHWGILGMRERAKRIGARLTFHNDVGSGLEIELLIPGRLVFDGRGSRAKESLIRNNQ